MFIFFFKSLLKFNKLHNIYFIQKCKHTKLNDRFICLVRAATALKLRMVFTKLVTVKTNYFFLKKYLKFRKKNNKNCFFFGRSVVFGFLNNFLLHFFQFFFKKKILFFFKKKRRFKNIIFFNFFKKIKPPYGIRLDRTELLYIIYYSLLLKDSVFFLNYCCNVFENNHIRTHRRFFFFLKKIFRKCRFFFKRLKVRGIFLDLKGKISVTGNAKKRRLYFRCRWHSLTRKRLKLAFKKHIIKTTTGVLGITAYIFF